jgi:hypothetical protein
MAIAFPFRKLELSNVDTAVSGRGHFQDFRPGFRFWHICHVDRHGHFTQLRLPVLNETHTNSYTGPRLMLNIQTQHQILFSKLLFNDKPIYSIQVLGP